MKKILFIFILFSFNLFPQDSAGSRGGGGIGFSPKINNTALNREEFIKTNQKLYLFDLFKYHRQLPTYNFGDYCKQINNNLKIINLLENNFNNLYGNEKTNFIDLFCKVLLQIKKTTNSAALGSFVYGLENLNWVFLNQELTNTQEKINSIPFYFKDQTELQENYNFYQIAVRDTFQVNIDKPLWDKLDTLNKVFFVFHEIIYSWMQPFPTVNGNKYIGHISRSYIDALYFSVFINSFSNFETKLDSNLVEIGARNYKDVFHRLFYAKDNMYIYNRFHDKIYYTNENIKLNYFHKNEVKYNPFRSERIFMNVLGSSFQESIYENYMNTEINDYSIEIGYRYKMGINHATSMVTFVTETDDSNNFIIDYFTFANIERNDFGHLFIYEINDIEDFLFY